MSCLNVWPKQPIAAMGGVEADSGNSALHSSATGPKGDTLAPPASVFASEISVVDERELSLAISSGISLVAAGWKMDAAVKTTLERIRPYLRTSEPVMVAPSLEALRRVREALTWLCVREVNYDIDVRHAPDLTKDAWEKADEALTALNAEIQKVEGKYVD